MKKASLISFYLLLATCAAMAQGGSLAEDQKAIVQKEEQLVLELKQIQTQQAATEPIATKKAIADLPGSSSIQKEKYDTTVIVGVPNEDPQKVKPAPAFGPTDSPAPEGTPGNAADLESDLEPVYNPQAAAVTGVQQQPKGFKLVTNTQDDDLSTIPPGTLAVYIDIEEAFNKNPWTLQSRKNIKLELETKQIEFVQLKEQIQELKLKEKSLMEEIRYYSPFYNKPSYIAPNENTYPKVADDALLCILNTITFCGVEQLASSPENTPQKLSALKSALRDTKKAIIEKEAFMLNYTELSREEILSKQDYIVQQILKEIYMGIKEYSSLRNIGLVVDKKELVYGTPLNVTPEFVKWMKTYHKKYIKQNGDIL